MKQKNKLETKNFLDLLSKQINSIKPTSFEYYCYSLHKLYKNTLKSQKTHHERTILNYLFNNLTGSDALHIREHLFLKIQSAHNHIENIEEKITKEATKIIKKSHVIFTHSYYPLILKIFKTAHKQKHFTIHIIESRPCFFGRKTAQELKSQHITVGYFVDAALRQALKKADLALLGCHTITKEGDVIGDIGSELIAELADRFEIPLYICVDSWDVCNKTWNYPKQEKATKDLVWEGAPSRIKINTYLYEKINPNLITGIISELGIFKPAIFLEEALTEYPWLFK